MTALRQAVDALLGEDLDLEQFVRSRRDSKRPWRRVALDLYDTTGVFISYETLRGWFPEDDESEAAAG